MEQQPRHKKVLVLDDQVSACILIERVINSVFDDVHTEISNDSSAGLAWARQNDPDLIIVDFRMPNRDGLWLLKEVRKDQGALGSTPVIMVSGVKDQSVLSTAFDAGVTEFLFKPINPDELSAKIRQHLGETAN